MKKLLKALLCLILILVLAVAALFAWLTVTEYKPAAVEDLTPLSTSYQKLSAGQTLDVLSWNIGYGGLGKASDFFMDGGSEVRAAGPNAVGEYLNGIKSYLYGDLPDLVLLQEVDTDSSRTYDIDETAYLTDSQRAVLSRVYAMNYSCSFVPFPLPPMGKVHSGLYTMTQTNISSAQRIALPCPFSWPTRTANLKRCLLVSYLPIEGSESQLVLVNLHLEAYDDGEGKIAQTKQLRDFIQSEYEKGNYVIAGGDFNQAFPGSLEVYPNTHPELWSINTLDDSMLPEGWQFACDLSTPTCRLLNQPYNPEDTVNTQYYVIDGFILSPNVQLNSVESVDLGFENSDHNPVRISVTLQ